MQALKDSVHIPRNKAIENNFEKPIIRPREYEISSPEGVSAGRGTAPWYESNLERNFNKTRIKELEL